MNKIIVNYIRVSDSSQAANGSGLDNQRHINNQAIERLMEKDDYVRLDDIVEAGVSAYRGANLQEILTSARNGAYPEGSVVVMFDMTRFSREEFFDAATKIREIALSGLLIHFSTTGQTISPEDVSDFGRFVGIQAQAEAANKESRSRAERTIASYQKRVANGEVVAVGNLPNWISKVYDTSHTPPKIVGFEVIPKRGEVIRKIFEMYNDGKGANSIVRWLNENEAVWMEHHKRVAAHKNTRKIRSVWNESYVTRLLTDYRLIGRRVFNVGKDNESQVDDYYPITVPKGVFYQALEIRKTRTTTPSMRKYPPVIYMGITFCGYCGSRFVVQQQKNKSASIRCSGHAKGESVCFGGSSRARFLEQVLIELCKDKVNYDLIFKGNVIDVGSLQVKQADLTSEIDLLQPKLDKLLDLLLDGVITKETFVLRKENIEENISKLKQDLVKVKSEVEAATHLETTEEVEFLELLNQVKHSEIPTDTRLKLKSMLPKFIKRIDVYRYGSSIKTDEQWEDFKRNFDDDELTTHIEGMQKPTFKDKEKLTYNIIFNTGESRAVWFSTKEKRWTYTATIDGFIKNSG
ncbi:recombinase family protein [Thalassotalea nanhaiensis]|uniref:Recombinase family protein n=1 Tax=Thalassotalea nanhaiensis TaxID=3065648 RepID=A0ABY9TFT3_9GAMM|nr:recombinase family protein [Colwelliaceae bacterium SQ345]